jgi:ribosome maturation protein SDO1
VLQIAIGVDKAVVARLTVSGQKFEILVDPKLALQFRKGEKVSMNDVVAYPVVYKDTKTSESVSPQDLQKSFGVTDPLKVAERILKEGELQLTTEQRREMVEQKRTQIAALISKRGVNPQTNTPHPPQRITNAMDQAGVNIDPFTDAEMQVDKIVKAIKTILPIAFQKVLLQIKIPAQFAGKAYSVIKASGDTKNEQWLNDGSLQIEIEMLAGLQDEFFQKIASMTHGSYESKILRKEDV